MGIVEGPQKIQQNLDLRRIKETVAAVRGGGDSGFLQGSAVAAYGVPGPEQHRNIRRMYRAKAASVPDGNPFLQQLYNPLNHPVGLSLIFAALLLCPLKLQHMKLHMGFAGLRVGLQARIQTFVRTVDNVAHLLRHHRGENMVDRLQNLRPGAEVFRENQLSGLSRRCLLRRKEVLIFFQEDRRLRLPKPIDGLFHVSHKKAVLVCA